jgi:histidinol-phosphatase
MLREWVRTRFPNDGVLGEEFAVHNPDAARRWIIDPIDGTKSFMRGVPLWGTLVAVARGEEILAGAIACSAANVLVSAAVGQGCWFNGARCHVSDVSDLSKACVLTSDARFTDADKRRGWDALAGRASVVRTWGDCYGYAMIAAGRADVMCDPSAQAWDVAALVPVITEAGGVLTDWQGRATAFGGSIIATNAALARDVRVALGVQQGGR